MDSLLADKFRTIINAFYRMGPRNIGHYRNLVRSRVFLEMAMRQIYPHTYLHEYEVKHKKFHNVVAEKVGEKEPNKVLIVGAHYDSHRKSPGGNDNSSAIAVLLQLAEDMSSTPTAYSIRFVGFVNKESPFTNSNYMGSRVYAQFCRDSGDEIIGMLCLDTITSYFDSDYRQLKIMGNRSSRALLDQAEAAFLPHLPIRREYVQRFFQKKIESDHLSFWKENFPAILITEDSSWHMPHHRSEEDTPEKLNYAFLVLVYEGLSDVVEKIAGVFNEQKANKDKLTSAHSPH